jgi:hypothetical protein
MKMLIVFLVKLSFDIGHESMKQGLNGRVRKKVSCVVLCTVVMCD